jgi:hypothetical protein
MAVNALSVPAAIAATTIPATPTAVTVPTAVPLRVAVITGVAMVARITLITGAIARVVAGSVTGVVSRPVTGIVSITWRTARAVITRSHVNRPVIRAIAVVHIPGAKAPVNGCRVHGLGIDLGLVITGICVTTGEGQRQQSDEQGSSIHGGLLDREEPGPATLVGAHQTADGQ